MPSPTPSAADSEFRTTRWSVVLRARDSDPPVARAALELLCRQVWFPLYTYVRRRGFSAEDAQDLTQGFVTRLLESGDLDSLSPARGRMRSFLLTALQHFVANHRRSEQTLKRGDGITAIPIDLVAAEGRFAAAGASSSPEHAFDRQWALELLERVLALLAEEYSAAGRGELFAELKSSLTGEPVPHAEIAERLSSTAGAIKIAAHRLRKRYGEILRREIAQTLARPEDLEDEIQSLFEVLGRSS